MSREDEIKKIRIEKIKKIRALGMDPYIHPSKIKQDLSIAELKEKFNELEISGEKKHILGRILVKRGAGKISFVKIFDGTGKFQVVLKADVLGKEKMKIFEKLFDIGDFVQFYGSFFRTQRGEASMLVEDFLILGKSLLPLPEKWHGLQDKEEKYRKRYLDLLSDEDTFRRFQIRAKIISKIREILDKEGFLEIETPILQNQASGAMAKTFQTYHNDFDMHAVLRISLEAEHKMIMAGGYPAVYEIGRAFRNEGSDPTHMQEFTMIEWYRAFRDLDYNIHFTEKMLKTLAQDVLGKTQFKIENSSGEEIEIDFSGAWEKKDFFQLIQENTGFDAKQASDDALREKAIELGEKKEEVERMSRGNLLDSIWKKSARKKIKNPTWVFHYPGELKPLAIQNEDGTAEVAQLVLAGFELSNHYAELVDPITQRKLLEQQLEARKAGDDEAMTMNYAFLEAMEYGMPPMTGTGIGIDRLVGILTEQKNLRDTIFSHL